MKIKLTQRNFYDKNIKWRSRIVAIAPVLKTGTQQWVRGFESHLLRPIAQHKILEESYNGYYKRLLISAPYGACGFESHLLRTSTDSV